MDRDAATTFLLDTNIFVEAHRRYYSLDLCPGFWDSLSHFSERARLLSIDRVRGEIQEGDVLHEWISAAPDRLFVSTADLRVARTFGEMMAWAVAQPHYKPEAKAEFAQVADGWLVAYAHVRGHTVVTHEAFNAENRRRVLIPNVCRQFGVPYSDTFSMLRALEVRFGWSPVQPGAHP